MIRPRAIFTGLAFSLALCIAIPMQSAFIGGAPLGGGPMPVAPFVLAIILYGASAFASRYTGGRPPLSGGEILVVWLLTTIASGVAWSGLTEHFLLLITAPVRFVQEGFLWPDAMRTLLPDSWLQRDAGAVRLLYDGIQSGRAMSWSEVASQIPWHLWLPVLGTWILFLLVCYATMICIVSLFGRQWVENERMNYPLLRVPQLMGEALDAGKMGQFVTDRYLWWGLSIPVFLHLLNGLHFVTPGVPQIDTLVLAGKYFPKYGLLSGFHKLKIYIVPAFIGFAFLASRQVSFSLWFFHLAGLLLLGLLYVSGLQAPEAALGVTLGPDFSRPEEAQSMGAAVIFFCFLLWLARGHLLSTLRLAAGIKSPAPESGTSPAAKNTQEASCPAGSGEWMSAVTALRGAVAGLLLMGIWCHWAGVSIIGCVALPLVFFLMLLVVSRLIAQGGLPGFSLSAAPTDGLTSMFGSGILGGADIAVGAVMQKLLFADMRESVMPALVHGSKVTDIATGKPNPAVTYDTAESAQSAESAVATGRCRLLWSIALALVIAVGVSFFTMLMMAHRYGLRDLRLDFASRSVMATYENAWKLLELPTAVNEWAAGFIILGMVIMLVLVVCFTRFYWWPLHPLGYLAAYSPAMRVLWFSLLIGWLGNQIVLRYGGTRLYRRIQLFFVGLVAGDFLMAGGWAVVSAFTNNPYRVFPF
ncbi:DUF6785 family protein [Oleidesulfovibrio sp.]|uniref:DUF6785 family protein n=1 Tax=Oleidesulfovibrio sp. TaxID=2909707 RepID=UPI003A83D754